MDWRQISELRKSGRLDEAYVTAQRLLDGGNEDVRVRQAMGWVLYERAREVVRSEGEALTPGDQRRLQAIVAELVSLDLPKADMLHSRLLALIVRKRGGDEIALALVARNGKTHFQDEDWDRRIYQGEYHEPFAETLARSLGKAVVERRQTAAARPILEIIDEVLAKANCMRPEWLHYRRGQILLLLGEPDAAAASLKKVLRLKPNEYWAWSALAEVYEELEPSFAAGYYAKALTLPSKKELLVNVFERFARAVARGTDYELASWAAHQALTARKRAGYSIPQTLIQLVSEDWMAEPPPGFDAMTRVRRLAAIAEDHAWEEAEAVRATYLSTFVSRKGSELAKLAVVSTEGSTVVVVPVRFLRSVQPSPGEPLKIRGVCEGGRLRVDAVSRDDGRERWDMLDRVRGVVVSHDLEDRTTTVKLEGSGHVTVRHDSIPGVAGIPEGVALDLLVTRDRSSLIAYSAVTAEGAPET